MVGALLCVVTAERPILDLSNAAHQRGASTISLSQLPADTPYGVLAALSTTFQLAPAADVDEVPAGARWTLLPLLHP